MTRKEKIWVITALILTMLIGLLFNMPARQVLNWVELPSSLRISGLQGSVHSARVGQLQFRQFSVSELQLRMQPLCLLRLAVCYQLGADESSLLANVQLDILSGDVELNESHLMIDSQVFSSFNSLLVKPTGSFEVDIEHLLMHSGKIQKVSSSIDWVNVGIEGEPQVLGKYHGVISTTEKGFELQLSDRDSLLKLEGIAYLLINGEYQLDIQLEARPGLKPSVKSALGLLAKQSGLNRYRIGRQGRLDKQQMQWFEQPSL